MYKISLSILLLLLVATFYAQSSIDNELLFKNAHHELMPFEKGVNTDGHDVAHFHYAAKLFFSKPTAALDRAKRVHTIVDNGSSVAFSILPNEQEMDMAHTSMTVDGKRIYYALTRREEIGQKAVGQIWYRDKEFDGKWGAPKRLPRALHLTKEYVSHPAAGILRESRTDVLFFMAELHKSKGGTDIWMCEVKKDGSFSQPVSLPFNSKADEVAPFFDVFNQTLYFSSNGFDTYGGYDVFRTRYEGDGKWSHPENLGRPINSFYDDLHFSFNEKGNHCYISSARPNPACPTGAPACRNLDIYRVQLRATLQVYLFDEENNGLLDGCNLELEDMATGEVVTTFLNLEGNFASVGLDTDRKYNLIVSKSGYFPLKLPVSAEGKDFFRPSYGQYHLRPMHMGARSGVAKHTEKVKKQPAEFNRTPPKKVAKETTEVVTVEAKTPVIAASKSDADDFYEKTKTPVAAEKKDAPTINTPSVVVEEDKKPEAAEQVIAGEMEQEKTNVENIVENVENVVGKGGSATEGTVENDLITAPSTLNEQPKTIVETKEEITEKTAVPEKTVMEKEEGNEQVAVVETPKPAEVEEPTETEIQPTPKAVTPPAPSAENQLLLSIKEQFIRTSPSQYFLVTDLPMVNLNQPAEPIDLLFYHQALQCYVVFDRQKKAFSPQNYQSMGDYLTFISTYKSPNQQPSIGVTLYDGGNGNAQVVYTFLEGMGADGRPSYFHTQALPAYYEGGLPQAAELIGRVGE